MFKKMYKKLVPTMDDCECICVTQPIFPHPIKELGIQNDRYKYDKIFSLSLRKHSFFSPIINYAEKVKTRISSFRKGSFYTKD